MKNHEMKVNETFLDNELHLCSVVEDIAAILKVHKLPRIFKTAMGSNHLLLTLI